MIGGTPETPPGDPAEGVPEITVDDQDADHVETVGAWTTSTSEPGYLGSGYLPDGNALKGTKSITFRPELPRAGHYRVYVRWTSGDTRATNAPVDVVHAEGTATFGANPRADGAKWNLLGTWRFAAGTTGAVVVRNAADDGGYVIADAVGFAEVDFDRDGDGLPDWWESQYFGDATNALATADDDGDTSTNLAEYRGGCNPTNAASRFEVSPGLFAASDVFQLAWPSASNRTYTVEATTDLRVPFAAVCSNIVATPPTNRLDMPVLTSEPRFFRLRAE
jgi:hypothetical protein